MMNQTKRNQTKGNQRDNRYRSTQTIEDSPEEAFTVAASDQENKGEESETGEAAFH
jgi:hypothetical protein